MPGAERETLPGADALAETARAVLDAHWQPEGYTVPNAAVYPHQWLWDSCFHAIAWAHLGEGERALTELRTAFAHQSDDGFVPHMTYWRDPDMHADFWGRRWTSSITQPPMYGHAIAELTRLGIDVDRDLVDRAEAGLQHLAANRQGSQHDAVAIVHPWESGCDDSPRWDTWCTGRWDPARWKATKGDLVAAIEFDGADAAGGPVGSSAFEVESIAFNALVVFNASELDSLGVCSFPIEVDALAQVLVERWHPRRGTFADRVRVGPKSERRSPARTAEALLVALVLDTQRSTDERRIADRVFTQLRDAAEFGGACGPAQVHRDEPAFDPTRYWRGPAWPQLNYLFWVAATRLGRTDDAAWLRDATIRGASRSGFAEHWHPDTGAALGAVPQSWTALTAVMAAAPS